MGKKRKTARQLELDAMLDKGGTHNSTAMTDEYIRYTLAERLGGLPIPEQLERTDLTPEQRTQMEQFRDHWAERAKICEEWRTLEDAR